MMKIDKAPCPLIVPDPEDPRLTERVAGPTRPAAVEIRVPVERLTLYLNAQEIVTMMTIGDHLRNTSRSATS
jgi:FdhD protein